MEDNPYFAILNSMEKQTTDMIPTVLRMGIMVSEKKLDIGGTTQDGVGVAIYKNDDISLSPGDSVLVAMLDDDQRPIILCKVAKL